jgi:diguanylate cyclase
MRDSLRNIDVIGRYGGDEFLVLLPHTTYDETLQTGERIRAAVADHSFRVGPREIAVTVSVGVTAYPREGIDTPAALVNAADSALYRAKESGRNRVV